MAVGDNIKKYREQLGLSQKELASMCGIGVSTIQYYEYGKTSPKLPTLQKIANALHVDIKKLDESVADFEIPLEYYGWIAYPTLVDEVVNKLKCVSKSMHGTIISMALFCNKETEDLVTSISSQVELLDTFIKELDDKNRDFMKETENIVTKQQTLT